MLERHSGQANVMSVRHHCSSHHNPIACNRRRCSTETGGLCHVATKSIKQYRYILLQYRYTTTNHIHDSLKHLSNTQNTAVLARDHPGPEQATLADTVSQNHSSNKPSGNICAGVTPSSTQQVQTDLHPNAFSCMMPAGAASHHHIQCSTRPDWAVYASAHAPHTVATGWRC